MTLYFKNGETVLTKITADYKIESVAIQNYTSDIIDCAFGKKENPSWEDYLRFLESRCFPKTVCNFCTICTIPTTTEAQLQQLIHLHFLPHIS